ncbi:MAG: ATP-binding protein [Acholeplasmataceae bacterium]
MSIFELKPIIEVLFQNVKNVDIAIIRVSKGIKKPYYITGLGIGEGTYVRYGSTDQIASKSQIREFILNQQNEFFTHQRYLSENKKVEISENQLDDFLKTINQSSKIKREITIPKLIGMNLLKEELDKLYPTNGLMLFLNNPFDYSYIRIGIFKGINKVNFYDDISIKGSILKQYQDTTSKLLEILKDGFKFGIYREPNYKIPEVVIREIIANAIIHRNYLDEMPIKISIFDDRIEVFSPGAFYDGLKLSDALKGISKLRNPNISDLFYELGIIDNWGSGILRANDALEKEYMNPILFELDTVHGVNVVIKFGKKVLEENSYYYYFDEDNYLLTKPFFTRKELEHDLKITQYQARYLIEGWLKDKKIVKHGKASKTKYIVK